MNFPLSYIPPNSLSGAAWSEVEPFFPNDPIRQIERATIRWWMEQNREYLKGRVLDFGAGAQPYKDLVEGEYVAQEKDDSLPSGKFDAVMINQVVQYLSEPLASLCSLRNLFLRDSGHLVMTYSTNWAECESTDLWRFTKAGMERLLSESGFSVVTHELRAEVCIGSFILPLGYGVVAQK